jgi:glucose/arabinose dehydrogenase
MLRFTGLALAAALMAQGPSTGTAPACDPDNAGLRLSAGFCATLFADSLGAPRHLDVAPNGDVVVAIRSTRANNAPRPGGFFVLRDQDGDGHAERRARFGEFSASEARFVGNHIYTEDTRTILRYAWNPGAMSATGPDTIVSGLPGDRGHPAKTFVIHRGGIYVNHGSPTNSCQQQDRTPKSPGFDPCPDLETRASIWRFDLNRKGQTIADGEKYATGIRNAVAMAFHPDGDLYVMQHGRDGLQDWGFTPEKGAETPAEEMFRVTKGADFGWPYCYFDPELKQKVLAPEYGGDGKTLGRCAQKAENVGFFPGHWAPNGLLFYTGRALPAKYRDGAFIVFHGSWNRAPLPQQGFKVVFQPMKDGRANGPFEVFADGFVDDQGKPTALGGRPMGLAQGPKGELYLSDDSRGRIWRITYTGK